MSAAGMGGFHPPKILLELIITECSEKIVQTSVVDMTRSVDGNRCRWQQDLFLMKGARCLSKNRLHSEIDCWDAAALHDV